MEAIAANILLEGLAVNALAQCETPVTLVTTDSREVCPGCIFVAFPGEKFDGHDFAAKALENGALCVVLNHPVEGVPEEKSVICPDSYHAMMVLGANYRSQFHPKVVGVTGSVGKTTTKQMTYAAIAGFGSTIKTEGNQNNELGLPRTMFRIGKETQYAVVEMGMSHAGEIERLSKCARPDVGMKLLSGNLQNGIKTLLNENVISPSDSNRKISNFIFKESTDSAITKLKLEAQYTGDNLYDVIQKICEEQGIGFKITLNDEKQFVFELYAGSDRSYDQTENPYVIFSPKFENIINSNYIESKASLKTVTLVGGEGEGAGRRYTTVGGGSGLNRRELFTDARDISSNVGSDDALTDAEYMAQLQQRGKEKLAENVSITSFEGETETTIMFQYGKDFFNGDIVQIANEYGHETKARILEIVRSEDKDGYSVYPTFKTIEQEGA